MRHAKRERVSLSFANMRGMDATEGRIELKTNFSCVKEIRREAPYPIIMSLHLEQIKLSIAIYELGLQMCSAFRLVCFFAGFRYIFDGAPDMPQRCTPQMTMMMVGRSAGGWVRRWSVAIKEPIDRPSSCEL